MSGKGYRFDDRYIGNGRFLRVGSRLGIAQGLAGSEAEDEWALRRIGEFFAALERAEAREASGAGESGDRESGER
jgi:hypothetical protein